MKMKASFLPCNGRMKVDCELNVLVICSPGPRHGLPSSSHGPKIFSATETRAELAAQPVQSEEMRKYFPRHFINAGASCKRPGKMRKNFPAGFRYSSLNFEMCSVPRSEE